MGDVIHEFLSRVKRALTLIGKRRILRNIARRRIDQIAEELDGNAEFSRNTYISLHTTLTKIAEINGELRGMNWKNCDDEFSND